MQVRQKTLGVLLAVLVLLPWPLAVCCAAQRNPSQMMSDVWKGRPELPWRSSYAAAVAEASRENKLLLLDFTSENCIWCRVLEHNTWPAPDVASAASDYVPVKIQAEIDPGTTVQFGVNSFPHIILAKASGERVHDIRGYVPPYRMAFELRSVASGRKPDEVAAALLQTATGTVAERMMAADHAARTNDVEKIVEQLRPALDAMPSGDPFVDKDAVTLLLRALFFAGRESDVHSLIETFKAKTDAPALLREASFRTLAADVAAERGNYNTVLALLEPLIRSATEAGLAEMSESLGLLASAYAASRKTEQLNQLLSRLRSVPNLPEGLQELPLRVTAAQTLAQQRQWPAVIALLETEVKKAPPQDRRYYEGGVMLLLNAYFNHGRTADGQALLARLKNDPQVQNPQLRALLERMNTTQGG